jgi:lipopolysaccharide transport system permease protein
LSPHHPLAFLGTGWAHRSLILRLARRKVQARYRGSLLGSLWTWIQPLLLLAVYTFLFAVVFEARWGTSSDDGTPFALAIFAGMVFFAIFADCVNEAPSLLVANQTYIRQVRFPIEVLPWVSAVAALFTFAVNLALLIGFQVLVQGSVTWGLVLVPALVAPLLLLTLGATWLLSSAGVFLRDLAQIAGVLTTALLFLSPIFYPASRIPESFRALYSLNPLVPLVEGFRAALFGGEFPGLLPLCAVSAAAWAFAWLGYLAFMKAKNGFADVL